MATAEDYDDSYEDEYDEDGEVTISGFTVLLVAVVVLALFSAIVWFAYQKGVRSSASNGTPPIVAADPNPIRTEREVALGGEERREVYDTLEGNNPSDVLVEAAADRDPLEGFEETTSASSADTVNTDTLGSVGVEPINVVRNDNASGTPSEQQDQSPSATTPQTEAPTSTPPASTETSQANSPATPSPQTSAPSGNASTGVKSGTHLVQVGAFRSEQEALGFYDRLTASYGSYVSDKTPDIQRADLGDKGIFYRLRVGPFASKDAASSYCTGLKDRGQECLVKAR